MYTVMCPNDADSIANSEDPDQTASLNIHSFKFQLNLVFNYFRESTPPQDGVIATYEEHEDSVYAVDWSSADPWVFASLSYDGRLVINRVPRAEKYKILL